MAADGPHAVLLFRSSADLQADVPTDLPRGVAGAINRAVHRTLGHIAGIWTVTLDRSAENGRWRLELRGPTGRHIWLFVCPVDTLTDIVAGKLNAFVRSATLIYEQRRCLP